MLTSPTSVEYFGKKGADGVPTSLTMVRVTSTDEETNIEYDDIGRPDSISTASGARFNFDWLSNSTAQVTALSEGGDQEVTTFDFSGSALPATSSSVNRSLSIATEADQVYDDVRSSVRVASSSDVKEVVVNVTECGVPLDNANVIVTAAEQTLQPHQSFVQQGVLRQIGSGRFVAEFPVSEVGGIDKHRVASGCKTSIAAACAASSTPAADSLCARFKAPVSCEVALNALRLVCVAQSVSSDVDGLITNACDSSSKTVSRSLSSNYSVHVEVNSKISTDREEKWLYGNTAMKDSLVADVSLGDQPKLKVTAPVVGSSGSNPPFGESYRVRAEFACLSGQDNLAHMSFLNFDTSISKTVFIPENNVLEFEIPATRHSGMADIVTVFLVGKDLHDRVVEDTVALNNPPVAFNNAYSLGRGEIAFRGQLKANGASEFELVGSPTKGTVTAFDPDTGVFDYALNSGASGFDTIGFNARNIAGHSVGVVKINFFQSLCNNNKICDVTEGETATSCPADCGSDGKGPSGNGPGECVSSPDLPPCGSTDAGETTGGGAGGGTGSGTGNGPGSGECGVPLDVMQSGCYDLSFSYRGDCCWTCAGTGSKELVDCCAPSKGVLDCHLR